MFPLVAISKRQTCVSPSTPEAELVAGSHGLTRELVPALDLCDKMLPVGYPAAFHEDKQAMIRVNQSGHTPTMMYLQRTQRISRSSLHELITGQTALSKPVGCEYNNSTDMAAALCTKGFTDKANWAHATQSIGMVKADPKPVTHTVKLDTDQ